MNEYGRTYTAQNHASRHTYTQSVSQPASQPANTEQKLIQQRTNKQQRLQRTYTHAHIDIHTALPVNSKQKQQAH